MNTNELGGAERSLIFQLINMSEGQLTFFIPKISESTRLELFLRDSGFSNIEYYNYPHSLYSISRSELSIKFSVFMDCVRMLKGLNKSLRLDSFDMVYLNGNKAAFLFLIKNKFTKFEGRVVWHLRDYYHSSRLTDFIWNFLKKGLDKKLSFICNSKSVKKSLETSPWSSFPASVIYNPVGANLPKRDSSREIKTIGFVSMMAPWKGVHEIILWSKLFEDELRKLGITNVKIYGENIYKTSGGIHSYRDQLKKLHQKFNSSLVTFEGNKDPKEIYQEIDCLIHYSIQPEPFGRVILEAFEAGIPVISTCLGGASELVQSQVTGLKVYPHDREGLFLAVEQVALNKAKTFRLIKCGIERSKDIQKNIAKSMREVLEMGEAS